MASERKLCFVIQGFGEKTDFATGKKFNLDASYRVIKQAVEAADMRCVRADEVQHSGTIDTPMYENLLRADLVIADLSTSNVNAFFELGVRYGLRPRATIIVAEEGMKKPFDVSHVTFFPYKHLGEDVGAAEADRIRKELKELILAIADGVKHDSPVYTFLPKLSPPSEVGVFQSLAQKVGLASPAAPTGPLEMSAQVLMNQAREAMNAGNFDLAQQLLEAAEKIRPEDDYIKQQRALATYKGSKPDLKTALEKAREILKDLRPDISNDPETLGLWGAVHKRLWEETGERAALDASVDAYERGYYLKSDYYNGINLAFVLNQRAVECLKGGGQLAESVADFVFARRVRTSVLRICGDMLAANRVPDSEKYWVLATAWEAAAGLDDPAATQQWKDKAEAAATADWMKATTAAQIRKIGALLAQSPLQRLKL